MLIVRPARLSDLDALFAIAREIGAPGLTVPTERAAIESLIFDSVEALAGEIDFPSEERYLLVATDTVSDTPLGLITLRAAAGHPGADYSYRNDTIIHASPELGVNHRIYALSLSHDLSGFTQLTPALARRTVFGSRITEVLTRAALLFISEHPQRFADDLIAPLPGVVDAEGRSPFWDAVGSKFFGVPFAQADQLALGRDRTFLAELMPHHPIYVPLLPEVAQHALGQTRDDFMSTYTLLLNEGFEAERYVDIFDGGPTFYANRNLVSSIRQAQHLPLALHSGTNHQANPCLISNLETSEFRAISASATLRADGRLGIGTDIARQLELNDHDEVRCVFL